MTSEIAIGEVLKRAAQSANATKPATRVSAPFEEFIKHSISSIRASETVAIEAMNTGGDVQRAVRAVMSAERNLQLMLAIRDRAVGAVQEITRMSL